MKPKMPEPEAVACMNCRWGTRCVEKRELDDDREGSDSWKGKAFQVAEFYYCMHPNVRDGTQAAEVEGRLVCGFREQVLPDCTDDAGLHRPKGGRD